MPVNTVRKEIWKVLGVHPAELTELVDHRSNMKPPMGRGHKKDARKRTYSEDDELDPMDPSSYSDAPRGGWYVFSMF